MRSWLTPNEATPRETIIAVSALWIVVWLTYWSIFKPIIFPSPLEVVLSYPNLWFNEGLGEAIISSLEVNVEALALSIVIALPIGYLSRVPLFYPIAFASAKLRFLSPAVFFLLLLFLINGSHTLKVVMLALGEAFFLVTAVTTIVWSVPEEQLDDARTLRMNEWEVLWYAVIRGTLHQVIDAIRDNAAMGFSMLMMVEGFFRSEGGMGVLFLNQQKVMNFAVVYAIAGAILVTGLLQDWVLSVIRRGICPYAEAS